MLSTLQVWLWVMPSFLASQLDVVNKNLKFHSQYRELHKPLIQPIGVLVDRIGA